MSLSPSLSPSPSPLALPDPAQSIEEIITFLRTLFEERFPDKKAVIAVSGGIDSALSLILLARAIAPERIFPLLLPFGEQNMDDAVTMCEYAHIPSAQLQRIDIQPLVESIRRAFQEDGVDNVSHANGDVSIKPHTHMSTGSDACTSPGDMTTRVRIGNISARVRMIMVYDFAKKIDALVCGTENKSEKYLGYFTRFGDEASDIEPLQHLYKTQVRQLAEFLRLPKSILGKTPSAGLWVGQTDEQELGFSYEEADKVLVEYLDRQVLPEEVQVEGILGEEVQQILQRVKSQAFKREVPYVLEKQ